MVGPRDDILYSKNPLDDDTPSQFGKLQSSPTRHSTITPTAARLTAFKMSHETQYGDEDFPWLGDPKLTQKVLEGSRQEGADLTGVFPHSGYIPFDTNTDTTMRDKTTSG